MRLQGTGLLAPGQRRGAESTPWGPAISTSPDRPHPGHRHPGPHSGACPAAGRVGRPAGGTAPGRALCGQVWTLKMPCRGADGPGVTKSSEQPDRKQLRGPD